MSKVWYNAGMTRKAKVNQPVETTDIQPRTKVLSNGAVYDMVTKRIVGGAITTQFTPQNAREMQSKAIAKKREVAAAAANLEVQDERALLFGDYAYLAESAINMQRLATSPEAGKAAVMAAQWLVTNTGVDEKQQQEQQGQQMADGVTDLLNALASFVSSVSSDIPMRQDIIDVLPD